MRALHSPQSGQEFIILNAPKGAKANRSPDGEELGLIPQALALGPSTIEQHLDFDPVLQRPESATVNHSHT